MSRYKKKINDYMTLLSNETKSNEGDILIYGDIVDVPFFEGDVSPVTVSNALDDMDVVDVINLRINSNGGSVPDGNAIINILDRYRTKNGSSINAYIEGIAASMGSGLAMVADKIYMASNALMMIHKPLTSVFGNANDIKKGVKMLEKAEETLVKNYMRHFKGTEQELRDFMADETWFTAEEALQWGLCDEITRNVPIAASANGCVIDNVEFTRLPKKAVAMLVPMAYAKPLPQVQDKNNKGVDTVDELFDYDEDLKSFGISEDKFKELGIKAETALLIAKTSANTVKPVDNVVLTKQQIVDALGTEQTIENILALAKAGMAFDEQANEKAKAYDKLVETAIDDALKSYIRAKGEKADEARCKKMLSTFTYSEILDQQAEWDEEAKAIFNAGKQVSQQEALIDKKHDVLINDKDYEIFKTKGE